MDKTQAILYSFRRCPYAMRARMSLAYSGIKCQHREILLKNKPQSMLGYSAKATVPVLVVAEQVIDESLEVMFWALKQSDPDGWLNNNRQFDLIEMSDNQFKPQLDLYKYSDRHTLTEVEYRDQSLWFLELLNKKLSKNQFIFGEKVSLADIAIFPFIRQYAFVNKDWFDNTEYIYLQTWLELHLNSELFEFIMFKYPIWQD